VDYLKLDVGCGANLTNPKSIPQGDVNCDIQKPNRKITNFVLCDAQHLPFKDGTFSSVLANHVIEHVDNPFLMLKEMLRVANGKVTIVTPFKLQPARGFGSKTPGQHRCHFNKKWFFKALWKLGVRERFTIRYSHFKCFPHYFMPILRIPVELKVQIYIRNKQYEKDEFGQYPYTVIEDIRVVKKVKEGVSGERKHKKA
jgi:hypothetical protein